MQTKNTYFYFKSALTPEQCQKIIDIGDENIKQLKSKGHSTNATTFGRNDKEGMKDKSAIAQDDKTIEELKKETGENVEKERYVRDSEVCWLNDKWIYDLIHPYVHKANEQAGWRYEWDYSESFQFTKYHKGGFYGWHTDGQSCHFGKYKRFIPGVTAKNPDGSIPSQYTTSKDFIGKVRKLSATINLNKPGDYDGGNLKFDFGPHAQGKRFHEVEEIRPQGSIIIFPSFVYHQVTPITRGTRYSLVLWSLGQPFK